MAMTMNGEVQLPAPRETVWAKLNDPDVLKSCISGCEELEKTEDNGFRATANVKKDRSGIGALQGQGDAERSRPAERLQDIGRRRVWRGRPCQGRRDGQAHRQGRRHASDL